MEEKGRLRQEEILCVVLKVQEAGSRVEGIRRQELQEEKGNRKWRTGDCSFFSFQKSGFKNPAKI